MYNIALRWSVILMHKIVSYVKLSVSLRRVYIYSRKHVQNKIAQKSI